LDEFLEQNKGVALSTMDKDKIVTNMREEKEEEQEKESEPEFEYVSEGDSEDEKWDVESILTTQTDTGYRPAIISERKKKEAKSQRREHKARKYFKAIR